MCFKENFLNFQNLLEFFELVNKRRRYGLNKTMWKIFRKLTLNDVAVGARLYLRVFNI